MLERNEICTNEERLFSENKRIYVGSISGVSYCANMIASMELVSLCVQFWVESVRWNLLFFIFFIRCCFRFYQLEIRMKWPQSQCVCTMGCEQKVFWGGGALLWNYITTGKLTRPLLLPLQLCSMTQKILALCSWNFSWNATLSLVLYLVTPNCNFTCSIICPFIFHIFFWRF